MAFERLAFVDLETSGVSPTRDRIVEIGVVAVDGASVSQWSTLLDPRVSRPERPWDRPKYAATLDARPPRFQDVAATLAALLENRLVIAHNARFDCNFLRAEFARVGVHFQPTVLCSVLLSRKLYPDCSRHDLDAIVARHALTATVRHRALPDADLVRQFWDVIRREHAEDRVAATVAELIAAPIYPPQLDPALIDRLPESAGVFILQAEADEVLDAGAASNLRRHVQNYFRIDSISARAWAISHNVADIRWKTTRGWVGARLELAAHSEWRTSRGRDNGDAYGWHVAPERVPAISVRPFDAALVASDQSYGVFKSARRARNALARLAAKHRLCLHVLGVAESQHISCTRCRADGIRPACMSKTGRLRELARALSAMSASRNPAWPYAGPVALRERGALHVLDRWCYLGAATNDAELRDLLQSDPPVVEAEMYKLTRRLLDRYADRVVPLARCLGRPKE